MCLVPRPELNTVSEEGKGTRVRYTRSFFSRFSERVEQTQRGT
jgi:hypothetical protein